MDSSRHDEEKAVESEEAAPAEEEAIPILAGSPHALAVEWYCPRCTGPMMRCQVGHVGIYGWWLEKATRPAGALGPARAVTTDVEARMCVRCGYTEFFAIEPAALVVGDDPN